MAAVLGLASGVRASAPQELQFRFMIPTENQSEFAGIMHLISQRVRASGLKGTSPLTQALFPDEAGSYSLLVRGTRVPDLLQQALPLEHMLRFCVAQLQNAPAIGAPLAATTGRVVPMLGGGAASVTEVTGIDETDVDLATVSLTRTGQPCLLVRFKPLRTADMLRVYRGVFKQPFGILTAGRLGIPTTRELPLPFHEIEVELTGEPEETSAILGLLASTDGPMPSTFKVLGAAKVPMKDQGPGLDLDLAIRGLPATLKIEDLGKYLKPDSPVLEAVALSRCHSDLPKLDEARVRHLLGNPEAGIGASIFRLETTRYPAGFLRSLLAEPRAVIRDAALEKILKAGTPGELQEALARLGNGSTLAWAAPILAARRVVAAVPALARFAEDDQQPYKERQTALFSLIVLKSDHDLVKKLQGDEADPIWGPLMLSLSAVTGKASVPALVRLALNPKQPSPERIEAAFCVQRQDRAEGHKLLKRLTTSSDADVAGEAAKALSESSP